MLFLALTLPASEAVAQQAPVAQDLDVPRLFDIRASAREYDAVRATINWLEKEGFVAADFVLTNVYYRTGFFQLEVMHKEGYRLALNRPLVLGDHDPEGRTRQLTYDINKKAIVEAWGIQ